MRPNVCILRTDGTNCDEETAEAFRMSGGLPCLVHVNELLASAGLLMRYQVLAIPGGFSYGDDIAAGRVLSNELLTRLGDQLQEFVESGRLVIGVCNGFQVLVRTGLLPFQRLGKTIATLASNDSGKFECRWVDLAVSDSPCVFTRGLEQQRLSLPVAHGEGKFVADEETLCQIVRGRQRVLTYAMGGDCVTGDYPANPNGSMWGTAAICSGSGLIFGLMPHPERHVIRTQHPNWRRFGNERPHGLAIFQNAVRYASDL